MRIHLLGIGGTGMGTLAGLLCEAGYEVTGSDVKIYPPMDSQLASLRIEPFEGYSAENIGRAAPDLVVIGNVIRRENPEAQEAMRRNIRYASMPEVLHDFFLKDRTPLVVAGTHGKTTTAALAAWVLQSSGEQPGYLIGGVGINFGKSYEVGKGPFFVVEGDEYDTAFFDKGPKFLHYNPHLLIITSIEFDHADIYRDIIHITESFRKLVAVMPPDGLIIANSDDKVVTDVAKDARCRVVSYGLAGGDYRPVAASSDKEGTHFELKGQKFSVPLWGGHNLANTVSVCAALLESGLKNEAVARGLSAFKGVKRRQEIVGEMKDIVVLDDFAHHPTAIEKTVASMRERFPDKRVFAIFEPRSNTSRRNIFQTEVARALSNADRVVIADTFKAEDIPEKERFDPESCANAIMRGGVDAHHISGTEHIVEYVMRCADAGDVLLVMSNGPFDGIHRKLLDALKKQKIVANRKDVQFTKVPK